VVRLHRPVDSQDDPHRPKARVKPASAKQEVSFVPV
jgi:hypothetical protein